MNFRKLFCDIPSTGVTAKSCKKQLNKADAGDGNFDRTFKISCD